MDTGNPETGTLANSEDPDEMQHYAAFHQGLHCSLRLKQPSWKEIHHILETFICDPLKYKIDYHILIVSIYVGKSIRTLRFKTFLLWEFNEHVQFSLGNGGDPGEVQQNSAFLQGLHYQPFVYL